VSEFTRLQFGAVIEKTKRPTADLLYNRHTNNPTQL